MLGYTEDDVNDMIEACIMGLFYLPPSQEDVRKDLIKTIDLLQGLLAEGRV